MGMAGAVGFVGGQALVGARPAAHAGATCARRVTTRCVAEVETNLAKAAFPARKEGVQRQEAVERLRERFAGEDVPDDETLEWFLADRRYDVDEAYTKLTGMLAWKKRLEEVPMESVEKEAMTGKAFFHRERDIHGRKVLVVRACKHITNEFPFESSEKMVQKLMDSALENMPPETETMLGIVEMRGFGMKNSDVRLAQLLVDVFFTYYPRRLSELLVVDAPLVFQPMWRIIKPLLRKYASIVKFVKLDDVNSYFDSEAAECVLQDLKD
mmetsp:Transcript_9984/g.30488  ORF Transcript_9984/g.30488 Transcript_9984/m.30488 type:complete len:269 (+) Transcript_9984:61-867(+)|eukprot:CAMPEP_0198732496 /NCGR_PEP_ID=MMETSP1475-20131203/36348_1 /TAXON_ID= ORGANISM="Unidentified sp., Strain CCMP1999" /NCGR_SAMPLE_ID=MMETSP1475 /ASSEMBLY_ACC=CAM_ASM_001111 /LENGTH=268 /DNA_ID=CAMNT_0044495631 /DNA_START=35 /DNA_END=841 /DNA_ORIENTATION=+